MPVLFLGFCVGKRALQDRLPWYDWFLGALGFAGWACVAWNHTELSEQVTERPADGQALPTQADHAVYCVTSGSQSMLGLPTTVASIIVIAFIFFGNLLSRSGGSAFFTDLAVAIMGRVRGGSAKIAVVASGLFGSISGGAVSNVVSTGVITILLMRQGGFTPRLSAAIESVASTGGQLMPPLSCSRPPWKKPTAPSCWRRCYPHPFTTWPSSSRWT